MLVSRLNEIVGKMPFAFQAIRYLAPLLGALLRLDRSRLAKRLSPDPQCAPLDRKIPLEAVAEQLP